MPVNSLTATKLGLADRANRFHPAETFVLEEDLDDLRFGESTLSHGWIPRRLHRRKSTVIPGSDFRADPSKNTRQWERQRYTPADGARKRTRGVDDPEQLTHPRRYDRRRACSCGVRAATTNQRRRLSYRARVLRRSGAALRNDGWTKTADWLFAGAHLGLYGSAWNQRTRGEEVDILPTPQAWATEGFRRRSYL